jgi:peptide/nickel transport system permease protein
VIGQSRVAELDMPGAAVEGASTRPAESYWHESWERLRSNPIGMMAGALILLFALVAIVAPVLSALVTHALPQTVDLTSTFKAPGAQHLLGTDELGRDTLTRLIWGGRVTLGIAFLTVAMSLTLGTAVGMAAGYYGGWVDDALMRFVDMVLAIPAIFLFILMSILFRPNPITLAAIIASVGWGNVARLVRGEVLSVKQRDFVHAAAALGVGRGRLLFRHVLPNVAPSLIVVASLQFSQFIVAEAAISFLGFGIQPPTPAWGSMLSESRDFLYVAWWLAVFPGAALALTALGVNLLGDWLRDTLDPKLRV